MHKLSDFIEERINAACEAHIRVSAVITSSIIMHWSSIRQYVRSAVDEEEEEEEGALCVSDTHVLFAFSEWTLIWSA